MVNNALLLYDINEFKNFFRAVEYHGLTDELYEYGTNIQFCELDINLTEYTSTESFVKNVINFLGEIIKQILIKFGKILLNSYHYLKNLIIKKDIVEKKADKILKEFKSTTKINSLILNDISNKNDLTLFTLNELVNLASGYDTIIKIINDIPIVQKSDSLFKNINLEYIHNNYDKTLIIDDVLQSNFRKFKNNYIKIGLSEIDDITTFYADIVINKKINTNLMDTGYVVNDIPDAIRNIKNITKTFNDLNVNVLKIHKNLTDTKNKLEKFKVTKQEVNSETIRMINIWYNNIDALIQFITKICMDVSNLLNDLNYILDIIQENI